MHAVKNIQGKFYPLTPEISRKLRNAQLTKHEMALWLYLTEQDPFGDKYWELPSTLEITEELSMSKASYFRARARLQELELFDFQEQKIDCKNLTGVSFKRPSSQKCELGSQKCELESQKCESESQKRENHDSKPLPDKDSGASQTIQTYTDFKDSLSDAERESFKKFGEEMARALPNPPQLLSKWIAKNWEEISNAWRETTGQPSTAQNNKWENHPNKQEWLQKINTLGFGVFIIENGDFDDERKEFVDWADSKGLIEY